MTTLDRIKNIATAKQGLAPGIAQETIFQVRISPKDLYDLDHCIKTNAQNISFNQELEPIIKPTIAGISIRDEKLGILHFVQDREIAGFLVEEPMTLREYRQKFPELFLQD